MALRSSVVLVLVGHAVCHTQSLLKSFTMAACSPKLVEISKYSSELDNLLNQCFISFDIKLQTRKSTNQWERETVERILEDNLDARVCKSYATEKWTKDHKQMSAIYNWLEDSTGLQARALPFADALRYLVETQKLKHHGQEADAQRLLAVAQDQIDQFLVSF